MGMKIDQSTKEAEAKNLADLVANSGAKSDAEFARRCKIPGGKSMLAQHVKAVRPISLECAIAYAAGLNVPLEKISPRIAEIIARIPSSQPYQQHEPRPALSANEPIPLREFSDVAVKIARLTDSLDRDGQMMLLGQAQMLAKFHPRDTANNASSSI